jgi:hypothetical protein
MTAAAQVLGVTSLCSTAYRAAWVRLDSPSLPRMLLTWVRAVRSVMQVRDRAISV